MHGESSRFLELKNITKEYQLGESRVTALKNINFTLHSGEFAALVGSSGSGKSTLLNILGCLDAPSSGSYFFQGKDVLLLGETETNKLRNRQFGFIFQSFNLIPVLSVSENVEIPLLIQKEVSQKERRVKVQKLLSEVGLADHSLKKPDQLSGGQRQRVAIARALVTGPTLVLADEPTANLDSTTAHQIIDLMQKLNQDHLVTFLFSTHDEKLIDRVKKKFVIRDGEITI
jgi:putative ABC transport system ATP-binding protein